MHEGYIRHASTCSRSTPLRFAFASVLAVTASLQSSRVSEPARPKTSGAAGGASTVPVCCAAAECCRTRDQPALTSPPHSLDGPSIPSQRAPGNIPFFEVNITEWSKRGEGMNAYVVYTIVTKVPFCWLRSVFKAPSSPS